MGELLRTTIDWEMASRPVATMADLDKLALAMPLATKEVSDAAGRRTTSTGRCSASTAAEAGRDRPQDGRADGGRPHVPCRRSR